MQKYPFIPARNFSFICSNILYKDFLMKPREKMMTSYLSPSFFPLCSGNIISSHKSLWKCHSHNKGFLMQKYPFIPVRDFPFILCKYLYFIGFVENLRTSLRKIYGHGVSLENLCINLRTNKLKIPRGNKWIFLHQKNHPF